MLNFSLFSYGSCTCLGTVQIQDIVSRQASKICSNICDLAAALCLIFGCQALRLRQTRPASENTKDRVERAFMEQIAGARHSQRMLFVVSGDGLKEGDNIRVSRYTGSASQLARIHALAHAPTLARDTRTRTRLQKQFSFSHTRTHVHTHKHKHTGAHAHTHSLSLAHAYKTKLRTCTYTQTKL